MGYVLAKELKDAVLQSAFKGNLSSRNESDTSIISTLRLIKEERKKCNSNLKNNKTRDIEAPFDIPQEWKWVRLGDISNSIQYGANAGAKSSGNVKLVRITDIQNGEVIWNNVPYAQFDECSIDKYLLNENDILFARTGGTVGKSVVVKNIPKDGNKYIYAGYLIRTNYSRYLNYKYLKYFMNSKLYWDQLIAGTIGSAQPNCNGQTLSNMVVPFPPIEEQARIVSKIDEIMIKIDEYEKLENRLEELKKKFPNDMKQAVLQAAMEGKLTEQIKNDSDSLELAKKIKAQRNKRGKNKYLIEKEYDVNLPNNWCYIKSGECFSLENGEKVKEVDLPYLEVKYLRGKVNAKRKNSGQFVNKGAKVILVDGENSGEVFIEPEDGIMGSTFKVLYIPKEINQNYALYFLSMHRDLFRGNKKGSAIPHLDKNIFNNLCLPIPPIEEQQRIVEKLDKLLPLCEELYEV